MAAITKQLVQQVDQWIARHRDEMVDEVCRLIRFPSVADPNGVPPYGQNCREVLDAYLEIGKSHGLAARNHDYHVGELYCPQWEGKPKRIGLMGHLDVVPAGEGWIYPPFAGTVKDGLIIGRGSQDNKGPSIAGLYTVLCLRDLGMALTYDVCALAGTNEESGMDDARYYAAHCALPDLILVTDSGFPVCYGERPVVSGKMAASRPFAKIHALWAENVPGLVPRHAEALLEKSGALLEKLEGLSLPEGCGWKETDEGILCWADSVSGHPSFTDIRSGVIVKLLLLILENGLAEDEGDRETLAFAAKAACSADGAALGIDFEDEPSGRMKWSCGTLSLEEGRLQLGFSARCPLTVDPSKVFPAVLKSCEAAGFTAVQTRFLPGNHFPKSTPVIQTLDKVFRQTTGLDWPPQVFSAGTHARQLPSAVAYGPGGLAGTCVPDSGLLPYGHGGAYQPDECQSIDALCMALKVYILAVAALDGQPLGKDGK